jgi:hypothetical protein
MAVASSWSKALWSRTIAEWYIEELSKLKKEAVVCVPMFVCACMNVFVFVSMCACMFAWEHICDFACACVGVSDTELYSNKGTWSTIYIPVNSQQHARKQTCWNQKLVTIEVLIGEGNYSLGVCDFSTCCQESLSSVESRSPQMTFSWLRREWEAYYGA